MNPADMPPGTTRAEAPRSQTCDARNNSNIQPMVMIFDSKPHLSRQKLVRKPGRSPATASKKTFAFVHTSPPGKTDEESRRLVKTHVMQDVLRRKSSSSAKLEVKSSTSLYLTQDAPCSLGRSPRAPPSHFMTFPIQTEPYMLKLVNDYAGAMLPTNSKVIDSAWFPLIMTDAALFHALVSTSALFVLHDIMVQKKHMLESIRLINGRLLGDCATSDATITAILFMAKAEWFQQNYAAWGVHMDGVKRITELRGGIGRLPSMIQQKIYSADLFGCMEVGAVSHFSSNDLPKPLRPPLLCDLPLSVISLAETYTIDSNLLALLSEMNTYTTSSIDVHEGPSLQYRILSLHSGRQYQHLLGDFFAREKPFCDQTHQIQSEVVQELLLIGALLFLSLPHNLELLPIRPIDYGLLLSRLKTFSGPLFSDHHILLHHPEFLLWISFLGEIFSATCISPSTQTREHSPFWAKLRAISTFMKVVSWKELQRALNQMWGIDAMYEKPYRCVWDNAMSAQEVCRRF